MVVAGCRFGGIPGLDLCTGALSLTGLDRTRALAIMSCLLDLEVRSTRFNDQRRALAHEALDGVVEADLVEGRDRVQERRRLTRIQGPDPSCIGGWVRPDIDVGYDSIDRGDLLGAKPGRRKQDARHQRGQQDA